MLSLAKERQEGATLLNMGNAQDPKAEGGRTDLMMIGMQFEGPPNQQAE